MPSISSPLMGVRSMPRRGHVDVTPAGTTPYTCTTVSPGALTLGLRDPRLECLEALLDVELLLAAVLVTFEAADEGITLPPVDPHLARLVDRRDHEPHLDRQQLDVEQPYLDVPHDHD